MNGPSTISGKKLVWTGGIVLFITALAVRIFAGYYIKDVNKTVPLTQPTTQP
jgi:hypothetical protein